jgi:hypothetical protein
MASPCRTAWQPGLMPAVCLVQNRLFDLFGSFSGVSWLQVLLWVWLWVPRRFWVWAWVQRRLWFSSWLLAYFSWPLFSSGCPRGQSVRQVPIHKRRLSAHAGVLALRHPRPNLTAPAVAKSLRPWPEPKSTISGWTLDKCNAAGGGWLWTASWTCVKKTALCACSSAG